MTFDHLLGLPLDNALDALRAQGILPSVTFSRAPRRPDGTGVFRVVRISEDGARVTACGFLDRLRGLLERRPE